MNVIKRSYCILLSALLFGCFSKTKDGVNKTSLETEINTIKATYAPDKRVALFAVEAEQKDNTYIIKGESNLPDAVEALKNHLTVQHLSFTDSIKLLPGAELGGRIYALVNNSVANIRSDPKHAAELATQATLGTPLNILKKEGDWFLVQTPDNYISWVDEGGIISLTQEELATWKASEKLMYTEISGFSYTNADTASQIVSDLVAGCVLEVMNEQGDFYAVKYPDGRIAHIRKSEARPYNEWLNTLRTDEESVVETGKKLMGLPYLWGGTSTKGVDCSGYTKTIYFLNGMVIPRDASQQVHTGQSIDSIANFDDLKKGDLLFFGKKATDTSAEKVVHVGMWIGNNEFIHASNQVRISSVDPKADNFDEFNLNRYLRTKRILKEEDERLIDLLRHPLFKD
ncbi:MAG: NlpC/P60 family protein [Flavobacteriaceae bacterium]